MHFLSEKKDRFCSNISVYLKGTVQSDLMIMFALLEEELMLSVYMYKLTVEHMMFGAYKQWNG